MTNLPSAPKGLFITFEGVEGAGKTTQITALAEWLSGNGRMVELTREPGGTGIGAQIRQVLLSPENRAMIPNTELLLYAADRAQHVGEKIRPALAAGRDVLCDRYIHSTLAYQGEARGLDLPTLTWLNTFATGGLLPDLVILLDLDPAAGLVRAQKVGRPDRLEQEALDFHQRVRQGFLRLAKDDAQRFVVVDAAQTAETVSASIIKQVADRCGIVT